MDNEMLRKIQVDIRKNFGKAVKWDNVPKENFNCYMFAVSNTVPTEVFAHEENGAVKLRSLLSESVAYFGDIGQISGKTAYNNATELIEALTCDLETLGILAESCSSDTIVPEQCVKIAFYYNTEALAEGRHSNFHFFRHEGGTWKCKRNWKKDVEQLECPIEDISITGLELIGYFQLSLT